MKRVFLRSPVYFGEKMTISKSCSDKDCPDDCSKELCMESWVVVEGSCFLKGWFL